MAVRSDSLTFRVACAVPLGLSAIRQELATISQVEIIDLSPHSKGIGSDHECQGLVIYASQFSSSIADWIQKNPLEWIHLVTAGSDPLDAINISDSLHLSSSGHLWADTVAEHALAMLLTLSRGMNVSIQTVQTDQWSREEIIPRLHRIKDLNVLVVGYGRIGSKIGTSMKNLGAQVTGVASTERSVDGIRVYKMADLDTLIPHADVIFLSLPLNSQTHHLISKAQFELMRKSVFLINVSRGGVLDEEALYQVLVNGKLRGAGLDVFENEPLSLKHPLRTLHNVLLTPHVAGFGEKDIQEAVAKNVRDNLLDILAGRPPRNQIDRGPKTQ
jgi:phosphoglycerate dehydrogenase-like enzyme